MTKNQTYPTDVFFDIETLICVAQPTSILLLGDEPQSFLDDYISQKSLLGQACSVTQIKTKDIGSLPTLKQSFDIGIAVNLFEHLDKKNGTHVLSRLRDVLCPQYCACLPIANQNNNQPDQFWQLNELFSFALKRVSTYQTNSAEYGLFKYNINDYKHTPEWLNSDNWANPEMWGKYWW